VPVVYVSAASRLHALLTALTQAGGSVSLRDGWAKVLGIPRLDVQFGQFGLPLVAGLLSNAAEEARRADEQEGLPLETELLHEWSKPIYAPGGNIDSSIGSQQPSPEALRYLRPVASVLQKNENHKALPEADELTELLDQVRELDDSIEASRELPDDVRQALRRRIAQVRYAIENARIGGPEGVQEAVELLLGAAVVGAARHRAFSMATAKRIVAVGLAAYAVFAAGPPVRDALEAWPQVFERLTSGTEDTREDAGDADKRQEDREPRADKAEDRATGEGGS
jgi:hypothetical protein